MPTPQPRIYEVEQGSEEWAELRRGRITGSKLHGLIVKRGTGRKVGFYELLAERLGVHDGDGLTSGIERGHALEEEGLAAFAGETGKKVERVGFVTDAENEHIALSPDGVIYEGKKITEAVEVKCLSAARHLQAYFEKEVPSDYTEQIYQYFIVLPDLKKLHFVFYDPRIEAKPYHVIEVRREEVIEEAEKCREQQVEMLEAIERMVSELTF